MMQSENWLQHALRRTGWRPQRQAIAVGTLGVFIALILGALYLSQVAQEASRNRELGDLIARRDELQRTNEELRVEIAELQSLSRLQAEALRLGFVPVPANEIAYMVVEGYNANRSQTVAPLVPQEDELPLYSDSFGDWFGRQIDSLRRQFEGFNSQTEQ